MFIRVKPSGRYRYLQVENYRQGPKTRQRVIATLGRLDRLEAAGRIDVLLRSLGRFAEKVRVIEAHRKGELEARQVRKIGPDLVFRRLWQELGLPAIFEEATRQRQFAFPVERAVYLTVLHRLFESGSDRAAEREAILESLERRLQRGGAALVGNRGFRRFLKVRKGAIAIDAAKVAAAARYDGEFVLETNSELPAEEIALQYKRLLLVEQLFRTAKSVLQTRPVYHQWDATIRGHVFCSFLALVLLDELKGRLTARGLAFGWLQIRRDLEALCEVEVRHGDSWYLLRTALRGVTGKLLQAVGVAIPPSVQPLDTVVPRP